MPDIEETALVCGIVNPAQLAASMGQSEYDTLRRFFRNLVVSELHRYGAESVVSAGDACIASWRLGTGPLPALHAAQVIQQGLETSRDPEIASLPIVVGIHTATETNSALTIAIATRLQELNDCGSILITRSTFNACHNYVEAKQVASFAHGERQNAGGREHQIDVFNIVNFKLPPFVQSQVGRPVEDAVIEAAEQRPAAYRFGIHDGKIDVLPEQPETIDRELALDLYGELVKKAQQLHERLLRTNSAARVRADVEGLLSALGKTLDELRPGILLSRVRSLEADRAAFDSEEARTELFADAFAMIEDTLQSARDLMTAFPIIRRIEAERLALDLDRHSDAVPLLRERMDEIKSAVERSSAATQEAIEAIAQNDRSIEDATDPVLRTSLVADKLLVIRNFLGAAAGTLGKAMSELGEVSGQSWAAIKAELPTGVGFAARVAPLVGLISFVGWAAGPVVGIAAVIPLSKASPARSRSSRCPKKLSPS